ncbi:MAG: hypothetical protein ACOZIN_15875 [Myxococcota bacterium]
MRNTLLLCVGVLLAAPSFAATSPKSKKAAALVKEAEKLYTGGSYREAAAKLEEANTLDPHPQLLYNIARAYDQAGDLKAAVEYYQRYVAAPEETEPSLLKRANLALDRLRSLIAKEEAVRTAQEAERKRLEEKARAEAEAAKKQREEYEAKQRAEAEAKAQAKSRGRTLAFVSSGVAAAGAGAGIFFGLQAQAEKRRFTEASTVAQKQQSQQRTQSSALLADIGFGVGLAAAVATVVFWPKGGEEPKKDVSVVLVPSLDGAGVLMRF